ncbi:hypothetical protein QQF64_023897 [Cirrhinus molitorella]|uniref:Uncharacterized protein n=1 Tax=Cirrhinus molitorella TaxID=172907 RepID=A0ABR3NJX9_9TELE
MKKFEEISQEESFHVQVDETSLLTLEFALQKQVVQSPDKVCVMSDLKTASQWCIENSGVLLGSVASVQYTVHG